MSAMERIYRIDQMAGRANSRSTRRVAGSAGRLMGDAQARSHLYERLPARLHRVRPGSGWLPLRARGRAHRPAVRTARPVVLGRRNPRTAHLQHLLANLDTGGLLGPHIQPLLARLSGLLDAACNHAEEMKKRIRIETVGARRFHLSRFQAVGSVLLRRKRLQIRYHARGTDEQTEREISPQRLIYCAITGTSMPGATCATVCAPSWSTRSRLPKSSKKRPRKYPRSGSTRCSARATASSQAIK